MTKQLCLVLLQCITLSRKTINFFLALSTTKHANFMTLCFIEPELLWIEVLHCENGHFRPFLLLWSWPWPWPDDLHIRTSPVFFEMYRMCKYELCTSRLSKVIGWRTYIHTYTVNHKKRDILFLTVTSANLNRFLYFLHHFNREEILQARILKFTTSPWLCAHLTS